MQFVRNAWLAAACTLAFVLSPLTGQAQQTRLLPNDTELVVTFQLQQILKSEVLKTDAGKGLLEFIKVKLNQELEGKGLDKHLKNAGFELYRDLVSVTFAVPGGRPPEESFIVLEGKFDADKIEAAGKQAGTGFVVTQIANVKAYEVTPKGDKKMYVGIFNQNMLIACGSKADFAEAVARMDGSRQPAFKAAVIRSLFDTVNHRQSFSIVATSNVVSKLGENVPNADNDQAKMILAGLQQVDGFSAAITLTRDLDVQFGVNAKDAKTATQFAGLANAGVKAFREKLAEKAKEDVNAKLALDVLKTVEATSNGPNLMIRGQVTFQNLGAILKNLPMP